MAPAAYPVVALPSPKAQATERTVSLLAGSHMREVKGHIELFGTSENSDKSNRTGRRAVFIPPACYTCVPSTGQGDWTTFGLFSGSRHYLALAAQPPAASLSLARRPANFQALHGINQP
jgi:hypothetical protein